MALRKKEPAQEARGVSALNGTGLGLVAVLASIVACKYFVFGRTTPSHEPPTIISNPLALLGSADELAERGDHVLASSVYRRVLQDGGVPQQALPVVYYNLGLSLKELGDYSGALAAFEDTLSRMPRSGAGKRLAEAHTEAGDVAAKLGRWKVAARHYEAVGTGHPTAQRNAASALVNVKEPIALRRAVVILRRLLAPPEAQSSWQLHALLGVTLALLAAQGVESSHGGAHGGAQLSESAGGLSEWRLHFDMLADAAAGGDRDARLAAAFGALQIEDSHPEVSVQLLEACVHGGANAVRHLGLETAAEVYYRLGRGLRRAGRHADEQRVYEAAVSGGVWRLAQQRPGFLFSRPLLAKPWHTKAELLGQGWHELVGAISALEDSWEALRDEWQAALRLGPTGRRNSGEQWPRTDERDSLEIDGSRLPFQEDSEALTSGGAWQQLAFVRDGRRLEDAWSGALPVTEAAIRVFYQPQGEAGSGLTADMPRAAAEVSVLAPQTHLVAHCGPTNHRLRLHLPLLVPAEGRATMRVGDGEARPWVAGRVTILDDSFEHEIFNEATEETRVLLLIDVWHPQLTLAERDAIRRHFGDEPRWAEPRRSAR